MPAKTIWWPLFTTNFLGVLNDNFLKTLACFICVAWVGLEYEELLVTGAAGALVLPYVLLSPLAGRWAVVFSKKKVVRIAKAAEVGILCLAGAGFIFQWVWVVLACIVLMGTQSCLFSPAKYGLIRDIGGPQRISYGTGLMEMVSFLGMLSGTLAASFLSGFYANGTIHSVDLAAIMITIALLGFATSLCLKATEAPPEEERETLRPFKYLLDCYREARTYPGLNRIIFVLSVFWFVAGIVQMTLLVFCRRDMGLNDFQTGFALTLAAIGTGAGCFLSGLIAKKERRTRIVTVTGLGTGLLFLSLFFFPMPLFLFGVVMTLVGLLCGLYKVPFDASIQEKVPGRALGRMLAYANQVSFLFILAASAAFGLITRWLPNKYVFLFLAIVMIVTTLFVTFSKYLWADEKKGKSE